VTRAHLYLHALRVARPRQLRARTLRPLRRRRFPSVTGGGTFRPLDVGLWTTDAFAGAGEVARDGSVDLLGKELPYPFADWRLPGEPRLRRFHAQYGDEVLGWARRGEVAAAAGAIAAWISANPPRPGDAWHPYALSTRVGNWVAALSLAPELATSRVIESLRHQLAYLERNVEDDVLGNHVVRNARALVLGGVALGDRDAAEQGLGLLRRELPEQVLADGGHYERSPAYHLLVLRDLLEVREAGGVGWLDRPIERMRRFSAALARPDGRPALFNDGTLDLAPTLDLPPPSDGLAVFPETGYAVLRQGRVWLAFDCGPPAPPFLPAHAHADALSFQLWVDGRPAVVDPGTYTYEPGPDRDWFRSTRAHATVAVGGRDQFELWGAFRAGPLPAVTLVSTDPLTAELDLPGLRHRRTISVGSGRIAVEDEIDGRGTVEILSSLPLASGTRVEIEAHGGSELREGEGWLAERMLARSVTPVVSTRTREPLPARAGWSLKLASAS
jgi:hypothetical protein